MKADEARKRSEDTKRREDAARREEEVVRRAKERERTRERTRWMLKGVRDQIAQAGSAREVCHYTYEDSSATRAAADKVVKLLERDGYKAGWRTKEWRGSDESPLMDIVEFHVSW